jgi:hypothetical protein
MRHPLILVPVGIALAAGLGAWLFSLTPSGQEDAPVAESPSAGDRDRDAEAKRALEAAAGKDAQRAALAEAEAAERLLREGETELAAWRQSVASLLDSEEGRVLAGNDDYVRRFEALFSPPADKPRPAPSVLADLQKRLIPLRDELKRTVADPNATSPPSDAVRAQIAEITKAALEFVAAYRLPREQIESLLREARGAGTPEGTTTLAVALSALHDAEQKSTTDRLAEERARQAKLTEEAQLEVIRREGEATRASLEQQATQDAERQKREEERRRLEALANDPVVQAQFVPFLAPGASQVGPRRAPLNQRRVYNPPAPSSFSALRTMGATASPLAFAETALNPFNDRPDGDWGTMTEEEATRRLAMFLELAPVWVDMGKLKP